MPVTALSPAFLCQVLSPGLPPDLCPGFSTARSVPRSTQFQVILCFILNTDCDDSLCPVQGASAKSAGYPSLLLGTKKERKTNEEQKNFSSPTSFAVILIPVPSIVDNGRLSTAMKIGGEGGRANVVCLFLLLRLLLVLLFCFSSYLLLCSSSLSPFS